MTSAGLAPAWSATSLMPVSQRPFSAITCTAALRICRRRASESLRRGLMPAPGSRRGGAVWPVGLSAAPPHLRLNVQSVTGPGPRRAAPVEWEAPCRPGTRSSSAAATTGWWRARTWPGRGPARSCWRPDPRPAARPPPTPPGPRPPEIKVTRLSYVMSLMPPGIVRDLELERHGYRLFPMGPYYQAWPDGRSLTIWADDRRRNHEQIARFSKSDAEAMPRWDAWLGGLAAVLGPLLTQSPPRLGSGRPSDLRD